MQILIQPQEDYTVKPEEIKAHLDEIRNKIAAQVAEAGDLTQEEYDDVVKAVVGEYEAAKKITLDEAHEIEANLQGGFEAIKATIHQHTAK
jgi:hypothetical protein